MTKIRPICESFHRKHHSWLSNVLSHYTASSWSFSWHSMCPRLLWETGNHFGKTATTMRKVGRKNSFRKRKVSTLLIGAAAPEGTVLGGPLRGLVWDGCSLCHHRNTCGGGQARDLLELGDVWIRNLNFRMTNSERWMDLLAVAQKVGQAAVIGIRKPQ